MSYAISAYAIVLLAVALYGASLGRERRRLRDRLEAPQNTR